MEQLDISFARNLKAAREKAGLSQAALAKEAGVALQSISAYESTLNHKSPSINNAVKLANALNVSLDWLCGRDDTPTTDTYDTYKKCALEIIKLKKSIPETCLMFSDNNALFLSMQNEMLYKYFKDYSVMIDLYDDGAVPESIYLTWLTSSLGELDINIEGGSK